MTYARVEDGWIRVPYSGPELGRVEIGLGEQAPTWVDAFLNTVNGERVAQIRPVAGMVFSQTPNVWLRVDNVPLLIGRLGEGPAIPMGRRRRG
jgi:hypothetical protein